MGCGKFLSVIAFIALGSALALAQFAQATVVTTPSGNFAGPDSVITFETGSTALPSVPGVTLTPYGNADSTFSPVLFGSQVYGDASTAGGYTDLYVLFAQPVTEVGAWGRRFGSSGPTLLHVNVYGPSNNLLEGSTPSAATPSPSFVGFIEPQGISKIEWLGGNAGFFAVDNVTYGGPPVPEPAPIVGLAVLGAAMVATRRRSTLGLTSG